MIAWLEINWPVSISRENKLNIVFPSTFFNRRGAEVLMRQPVWTWRPLPNALDGVHIMRPSSWLVLISFPVALFWQRIKTLCLLDLVSHCITRDRGPISRPIKRARETRKVEWGPAHLRALLSSIRGSRSGNPISHLGRSPGTKHPRFAN